MLLAEARSPEAAASTTATKIASPVIMMTTPLASRSPRRALPIVSTPADIETFLLNEASFHEAMEELLDIKLQANL